MQTEGLWNLRSDFGEPAGEAWRGIICMPPRVPTCDRAWFMSVVFPQYSQQISETSEAPSERREPFLVSFPPPLVEQERVVFLRMLWFPVGAWNRQTFHPFSANPLSPNQFESAVRGRNTSTPSTDTWLSPLKLMCMFQACGMLLLDQNAWRRLAQARGEHMRSAKWELALNGRTLCTQSGHRETQIKLFSGVVG